MVLEFYRDGTAVGLRWLFVTSSGWKCSLHTRVPLLRMKSLRTVFSFAIHAFLTGLRDFPSGILNYLEILYIVELLIKSFFKSECLIKQLIKLYYIPVQTHSVGVAVTGTVRNAAVARWFAGYLVFRVPVYLNMNILISFTFNCFKESWKIIDQTYST